MSETNRANIRKRNLRVRYKFPHSQMKPRHCPRRGNVVGNDRYKTSCIDSYFDLSCLSWLMDIKLARPIWGIHYSNEFDWCQSVYFIVSMILDLYTVYVCEIVNQINSMDHCVIAGLRIFWGGQVRLLVPLSWFQFVSVWGTCIYTPKRMHNMFTNQFLVISRSIF